MVRTRRDRRPRGERGATAVELAIVTPLFLMLVMGTLTGGAAYNRKLGLTHAAREGTRWGATLATGTGPIPDTWFDQIADRGIDSAAGEMDPVVPGHYVCVAYVGYGSPNSSTQDRTRKREQWGSTVTYSAGSLATPSGWCFDDGRGTSGTERRVQVLLRRTTQFDVVLWAQSLTLGSEAVARFEAVRP